MPPIQASMVRLMRKSFPTCEIWSSMYLVNFIALVCVFFSKTQWLGIFEKMLNVTLSKASGLLKVSQKIFLPL